MKSTDVKYIFVYGSLRPDDNSGQPWTKDAVAGMKAEKARLRGAKLFHDNYACVVLEPVVKRAIDQSGIEKSSGQDSIVHGYVLSIENPELFREKLSLYDRIEGYKGPNNSSNFYDRTVVDVELDTSSSVIKAYIYHGTNRCSKRNIIPSGDWLKRKNN